MGDRDGTTVMRGRAGVARWLKRFRWLPLVAVGAMGSLMLPTPGAAQGAPLSEGMLCTTSNTASLGANAQPVPTFTQATVSETAKVFTGWSFANVGNNFTAQPPDTKPAGAADSSGWLNPIIAYENYHDESAKVVIDGTIPAGQTAEQDVAKFNTPELR